MGIDLFLLAGSPANAAASTTALVDGGFESTTPLAGRPSATMGSPEGASK